MNNTIAKPSCSYPLLIEQDGSSFEWTNAKGNGPCVLMCEHASNRIPNYLNSLGLTDTELQSHVAWDPGAHELGLLLSGNLQAPFIAARFSRLVYDCNRPPESASAMPSDTEVCPIPGNQDLTQIDRDARTRVLYEPFHASLKCVLDSCNKQTPTLLVTMHSFKPMFYGKTRTVETGLLHGADDRLATAMMSRAQTGNAFDCRFNEPYAVGDGVLHTLEKQLSGTSIPSVMIEVRNGLIKSPKKRTQIANYLIDHLVNAVDVIHLKHKQEKADNS